ncbi:MAG: hypothetical protein K2R98_23475 [Gemmataceae bacterium]|nr:hypothetical protein [Gemmataceae bacterium]
MNALAKEKVGEFFNKNFIATYQKVGTFRLVNGQKQGGNVASYFCLGDGTVLHCVAGPVDGDTLLREAKWVVETRKLAMLEATSATDAARKYKETFRKAHAERLMQEHGGQAVDPRRIPANQTVENYATYLLNGDPFGGHHHKRGNLNSNAAKVHTILAAYPLVPVSQVYKVVFEKILNEKISTQPVAEIGASGRK